MRRRLTEDRPEGRFLRALSVPSSSVEAAAGAVAAGAAGTAAAPAQRLAGAAAPLRERREGGEHPLAAVMALRAGRRVVHARYRSQQLEPLLAAPAVVLVQRHRYLRCYSRPRVPVNGGRGMD